MDFIVGSGNQTFQELLIESIENNQVINFETWLIYVNRTNKIGNDTNLLWLVCSIANHNVNRSTQLMPEACLRKPLHPVSYVLLCIILTILAVGTFIGNGLLILAFILVKRLRTPCNMLIINLAFTDLLVGVIVIPMASIYQIYGYWLFNQTICDVFILFDVLLCTSSILNLCAISIDRYFVITKPFTYMVFRTKKYMLLMIMIAWFASGIISIPPLFGWRPPPKRYACDYSDDLGYQIYATFIAFYLPLIIMLILYGRIFMVAKKMVHKDNKLIQRKCVQQTVNNKLASNKLNVPTVTINNINENDNNVTNPATTPTSNTDNNSNNGISSNKELDDNLSNCPSRKGSDSKNSEAKAVKTLGVIMGCFLVCWLPFFTIQLLKPILSAFKININGLIPPILLEIFYWLGYTNSFLNPIIYAIFNQEFRTPLYQIIKCRCRKIEAVLRREDYSRMYGQSQMKALKSLKDLDTPSSRRRSPQRLSRAYSPAPNARDGGNLAPPRLS